MVLRATLAALNTTVSDLHERDVLAALLTAWLFDESPSADAPPLTQPLIDSILGELNSHTN
jgi:hypothetical protein